MGTIMWASSDFFKRSLNYLTSKASIMSVCSTKPLTIASALGTSAGAVRLARSSSGSGAVFGAPGSTTSGWTVKSSQLAGVTVSTSGTAKCVAVCAGTSVLMYVTSCADKALTTADTVTIPSFNVRIANPTSS